MQQPQWAQPHPNVGAPDPAKVLPAGQAADAGQHGTSYSQWGGQAATGGGIPPTLSHSSYATNTHVDVAGRHGLAPADSSVSYPAQQAAWQQQFLQQQQQQQPPQSHGQYSQGSMGPPATMLQHQQLPPIPQLQSTLKPQQQSMPVLGQQLTEATGAFARHFTPDLTAFSRPATADMQAAGAAGLPGQQGAAHMLDAAGPSFTGFAAAPAAGVGSGQQWLGGPQQGSQSGQAQLLQSLLASTSSGMSGPTSLGGGGLSGTGSNDLLMQAALSGGGVSDEVVRALLLQKLAGQGGLDVTTMLLLQSLGNKEGAARGVGQQQGNLNELLMQMLLQQNQAQQLPQAQAQAQAQALAQQQQLQQQLLAAMSQQQQQQGSAPPPPSSAALAAAGWSGVGGGDGRGGSQGGMPPAAQQLGVQQQQLLQQLGAQQMALLQQQQQQQQASAAAAAAAPQLPPAAVSAVSQPPAGAATPPTVTPAAPAPTPSAAAQVAETPSAAGLQKAGSQQPRSPAAQQGPGDAQQQQQQQQQEQKVQAAKAEPEPEPAAAAAPDADVDRAAMAAMPVADKDGAEGAEADLLMLADTLMSMQGNQQQGSGQHSASKHRRPSSAAADSAAAAATDAAVAAAAPRPSTPAAAKSPGAAAAAAAAPSPKSAQQPQQEQQHYHHQPTEQEVEGLQEGDVGMSGAAAETLAAYNQVVQGEVPQSLQQQLQQQQQLSMGLQALLQQPDNASLLQYQQQAAALGLQPALQQLQGLSQPQLQQPEVPAPAPRRPIEPGFWERVLQDLLFYQEEDNRADDAAHAAATGDERAAKRPRAATPEGPLPPDRAALLEGDRQALQQLLGLLQQRQLELGDGFWQKAWHQLQRYLKGDIPEQQPDASGVAAAAEVGSKRSLADATSVEPVPMSQLAPEDRSALLNIYDPLKREHIASLQREIARLNAMGAAAGLQGVEDLAGDAAAAAAAAAAGAMMLQGMPYGFDPTFNWMYGAGGEGDDSGFDAQGQWRGGALRGRGGRPKGSGNRVQMAPRPPGQADPTEAGTAKFSLRSVKFTGVYRSRRSQEGWRAQFCYANKVINLGTFATEEEAARVWNEAALLFRGQDAWLNPVEPKLPEDYTPGELHLASDKAASAVIAAAVAAGLQPPKVIVKTN